MATFVHTFARPGRVAGAEHSVAAARVPSNKRVLFCRWRRGPDGRLIGAWSTAETRAGDEPAPFAFAAAA